MRILLQLKKIPFVRVCFLIIGLAGFHCSAGEVAVVTQHNNLSRTGANLEEKDLKVANVNTNQFGLLFKRAVDDQIYAQPLIATKVKIPGLKGSRNLVIVATVNDSVYAFDADDATVSAPYWQVSFLNATAVPPRNTDMALACGGNYQDFSGNIGIASTPVIDPKKQILYVLARTKEFGSVFIQKLHALDLRTGAEMANSPVTIAATCPGNGDGSVNGVLTFDPQNENQRSALALVDGVIYIGWASHGDCGPYHGWLMGYDATTLQQVTVYNTTPEGGGGGIWMSGEGPAADTSGNLYLSIGNGTVGNNGDPRDPINRGESFLKLARFKGNLVMTNWFTPFDYQNLEDNDLDLGSAGLLLIPNTTLGFSGGKEGVFYLVNRSRMGGLSFSGSDTNVLQSFRVDGNSHKIFSSPVWWDGSKASYAYVWVSDSDYLRQYQFDKKAGKFLLPQFAISQEAAPTGLPGGILSISANGRKSGTAIVWASHQLGGSANQMTRAGILRAFNAENVSEELWNSEQNSARDSVGLFAKFVPPTIANGKVYLATFSNQLNVYGLLPQPKK
jgi:hypothetical protein